MVIIPGLRNIFNPHGTTTKLCITGKSHFHGIFTIFRSCCRCCLQHGSRCSLNGQSLYDLRIKVNIFRIFTSGGRLLVISSFRSILSRSCFCIISLLLLNLFHCNGSMHQISILAADRLCFIVSIIVTRLICIKASLNRIIVYCHFLLLINDSFHIILNIKSIAGGDHNIPSRYHFIFIKVSTDIGIIHCKRLYILLLIGTGSKHITAWKCSSNRKNRSHHHRNCSLKNLLIHSLFLTF